MKHLRMVFLTMAVAWTVGAKAGDMEQKLVGSWTITDLKINDQKALQGAKCYLCDLYNSGTKLIFTAYGIVQYEDGRNPAKVEYKLINDDLVLSPKTATPGQDNAAVTFKVSFKKNHLVLQKISPVGTETYTLSK
ncbi:MAG: hypothetical protein JWO06_2076 [Bacteroidota bacterium]|nr:hypothetical protein [Bacteroidota bacterium]